MILILEWLFTNHLKITNIGYKMIPENEAWIDQGASSRETISLFHHMLLFETNNSASFKKAHLGTDRRYPELLI